MAQENESERAKFVRINLLEGIDPRTAADGIARSRWFAAARSTPRPT
jgi:hypothetical protein